ncbi:sensor histidine kinase [Aeromicrobium sp. UC242_57]|uniref:sensor histidine kinase n=1 Tax=Aeromicrobium sp. UC242_57 TaxID=3374624 RepID=UPI003798F45C
MLQALDASQERQRQLVADAGHELRTPLTSLRTNIELIGQAADSSDRQLTVDQRHEIMDDVRAQLEELTTLVGDLVGWPATSPCHGPPNHLTWPRSSTTPSTGCGCAPRQRHRRRGRAVDGDRRATAARAGRHQPARQRGEVEPRRRRDPRQADRWRATVTDEGPGINAEDLPHIFDRFYRSSEARTLPGSGLGLSIVKRAAERHGGTVEVSSPPGGGTQFTLRLPESTVPDDL